MIWGIDSVSLDRLMATIRALSLIALCVFDTSLQKTPLRGEPGHTRDRYSTTVLYMLH